MANGTQSIKPKNTRTQNDLREDASDGLCKAVALADVLAMMALNSDVESLHKHTLGTTLLMLCDILQETKGFVDSMGAARIDEAMFLSKAAEVADRQAAQEVAHG
jgi:hypothetical protein